MALTCIKEHTRRQQPWHIWQGPTQRGEKPAVRGWKDESGSRAPWGWLMPRHQSMPKSQHRWRSPCSKWWNAEDFGLLSLQVGGSTGSGKHWSESKKEKKNPLSSCIFQSRLTIYNPCPNGQLKLCPNPLWDHVTFHDNAIKTNKWVEAQSCSLENPIKAKGCKPFITERAQAMVREGMRKNMGGVCSAISTGFLPSYHKSWAPAPPSCDHVDSPAQISLVPTVFPALHCPLPHFTSITLAKGHNLLTYRYRWIQICSVCSPVLWASSCAGLP